MRRFVICDFTCNRKPAMVGFLSQGYYPSSPHEPRFALAEDVVEFFHLMYMKGLSSKQTFCHALQRFVECRTDIEVLHPTYPVFNIGSSHLSTIPGNILCLACRCERELEPHATKLIFISCIDVP